MSTEAGGGRVAACRSEEGAFFRRGSRAGIVPAVLASLSSNSGLADSDLVYGLGGSLTEVRDTWGYRNCQRSP